MPKNLLFTSLSLISGISKYQEKEEGSFKGMEEFHFCHLWHLFQRE